MPACAVILYCSSVLFFCTVLPQYNVYVDWSLVVASSLAGTAADDGSPQQPPPPSPPRHATRNVDDVRWSYEPRQRLNAVQGAWDASLRSSQQLAGALHDGVRKREWRPGEWRPGLQCQLQAPFTPPKNGWRKSVGHNETITG